MNLKIENMMKKIMLPKRYFDNTFIIAEKFSQEIENFLDLLKNCNGEEFDISKKLTIENEMKQVIHEAREVSDNIIKIFECYKSSDYKSAQELMDGIMKQLDQEIFIGTIDDRIEFHCNGERRCPLAFGSNPFCQCY